MSEMHVPGAFRFFRKSRIGGLVGFGFFLFCFVLGIVLAGKKISYCLGWFCFVLAKTFFVLYRAPAAAALIIVKFRGCAFFLLIRIGTRASALVCATEYLEVRNVLVLSSYYICQDLR